MKCDARIKVRVSIRTIFQVRKSLYSDHEGTSSICSCREKWVWKYKWIGIFTNLCELWVFEDSDALAEKFGFSDESKTECGWICIDSLKSELRPVVLENQELDCQNESKLLALLGMFQFSKFNQGTKWKIFQIFLQVQPSINQFSKDSCLNANFPFSFSKKGHRLVVAKKDGFVYWINQLWSDFWKNGL